jgi:hypothetical protein
VAISNLHSDGGHFFDTFSNRRRVHIHEIDTNVSGQYTFQHQGAKTMNLVRLVFLGLAILLPTTWTVAKAEDAPADTTTTKKTKKTKKSKKNADGTGTTDTKTETETKTEK